MPQHLSTLRLNRESASIGVNVDLREVGNLPINGRQPSQLYLQAPGAQNTASGAFGDIRFSGRAVEQNAIRFDGIGGSGIVDAASGVIGGELVSPFLNPPVTVQIFASWSAGSALSLWRLP